MSQQATDTSAARYAHTEVLRRMAICCKDELYKESSRMFNDIILW